MTNHARFCCLSVRGKNNERTRELLEQLFIEKGSIDLLYILFVADWNRLGRSNTGF